MEGLGGAALVVAAVIGAVWANSPWAHGYEVLWTTPIHLTVGAWTLDLDLHHVVNDGLMAIFFFVVGLEIKRELIEGALSDVRRAALPALAALGGMVVPAGLYVLLAGGGEAASGWGIPMATDIAFAIAVLSLTGVPHDVRILLLALAVVDDLAAILVIAIFYSTGFSMAAAAIAALCLVVIYLLQRAGFRHVSVYAVVGIVMWVAMLESGIHATIAGVLLGAITPHRALFPHAAFTSGLHRLNDELKRAAANRDHDAIEGIAAHVEQVAYESESPLERAQRHFHPWSSFVVLPMFALANSGVELSAAAIQEAMRTAAAYGVMVGLVVGKPLGILVFSWAAVRIGVASLPEGLRWRHVAGVGVLAGIGFTVSIFITDLAFTDPALVQAAKVGIFAASLIAAVLGWLAVRKA
jgi:NhaA family Na+:H+ antiporter